MLKKIINDFVFFYSVNVLNRAAQAKCSEIVILKISVKRTFHVWYGLCKSDSILVTINRLMADLLLTPFGA